MSEPIRYIERTRAYYSALGHAPYRWARYQEVPFTPPRTPLTSARLVLISTAAPYRPELGDQGPGAPYNAAAKFFEVYTAPIRPRPDLRISHVSYDRTHTRATDPNTWLPLIRLQEALDAGRLGALCDQLVGVPTNRSQRVTREQDAPAALAACRAQDADVALLVPTCPVCHQTLSLIARALETDGIATVIMGCARDIVEHVGVPRFVWSDFPLGNSAGKPHDPESQRRTLALALTAFDAPGPRTTLVSPQRWAGDDRWKRDYLNLATLTAADIERLAAEHAAQRQIARQLKDG